MGKEKYCDFDVKEFNRTVFFKSGNKLPIRLHDANGIANSIKKGHSHYALGNKNNDITLIIKLDEIELIY